MSGSDQMTGGEVDPEQTVYRPDESTLPVVPQEEIVHLLRPLPVGAGRVVRLSPGSLVIGRAEINGVVLGGSEVSRRHCQVDLLGDEVFTGGEVVVTDLGSTNGTFVDGVRITGPLPLSPGARIVIGTHTLLYERRSRDEIEEAERMARELEQANSEVMAVLPMPLREGPVRVEWLYQPCAALGGDCFGYRDLGDGRFAGYLLDVAGEGVRTAMHALAVSNALRLGTLPGCDPGDPAAVLAALDASCRTKGADGPTVSAFYWVFDTAARTLAFAAAGHHPAYLVPPDRSETLALAAEGPAIGSMANTGFVARQVDVPAGAMLYLFSDGAFAIEDTPGRSGHIEDFVARLLLPPIEGMTEPQRLYTLLRAATPPGPLDDDLCLVVVAFP